MSDHELTKMVSRFYDDINEKCNFKTRVNHQDLPERINNLIHQLSEETMKRYYGSGIVIPENIKGARILDIGCGSGSLVYILSKLVGPSGYVVGIDICPTSIALAKQESAHHATVWGYDKPNFEFHVANAERLLELNFEPFDLIVSNGVFCLVPDKQRAFNAVAALLKTRGQFYINDVYTQTVQPDETKQNEKLWSLGTAGSMIWSDLKDTVAKEGFTTPYLTQVASVNIKNEEFKKQLNYAEYACAAWRLFKLGEKDKRGPATVTYRGNIEDYEEAFPWDINLVFVKGQPVNVDSELASILAFTSFKDNFDISDYSGTVETKKNQDPFKRLADLTSEGKAPEPIYSVE
uniref:Arsenite methyltransferase n=1 Tax=Arion vulgaris TaxID=1028688 RepID=A0A0B7B268_9EUPU